MLSSRKIILLIVLLITLSITTYIIVIVVPARLAEKAYDGARRIGQDIREALHVTPHITVNNTVVLQQQAPVLELATVTQRFSHNHAWSNKWMGSTKKITITGTFEAKAGFDLNQQFDITITDEKAIITLPEPQLLSLEPQGDLSFDDENGLWNRLTTIDRSQAVNAFTGDARAYAQQAGFIQDARKHIENQLTEILKTHEKTVEFRYRRTEVVRPL